MYLLVPDGDIEPVSITSAKRDFQTASQFINFQSIHIPAAISFFGLMRELHTIFGSNWCYCVRKRTNLRRYLMF